MLPHGRPPTCPPTHALPLLIQSGVLLMAWFMDSRLAAYYALAALRECLHTRSPLPPLTLLLPLPPLTLLLPLQPLPLLLLLPLVQPA